jgi:hypothetical protein
MKRRGRLGDWARLKSAPHGNTKYLDGLRDALFSEKKLVDSNQDKGRSGSYDRWIVSRGNSLSHRQERKEKKQSRERTL